jgi:hypothetical protein
MLTHERWMLAYSRWYSQAEQSTAATATITKSRATLTWKSPGPRLHDLASMKPPSRLYPISGSASFFRRPLAESANRMVRPCSPSRYRSATKGLPLKTHVLPFAIDSYAGLPPSAVWAQTTRPRQRAWVVEVVGRVSGGNRLPQTGGSRLND